MSSTSLRPKYRLSLALGALAAIGGLSLAVAGSAAASVTYSIHAASDYSQARTWSNNGSSGQSWAKHGNLYASTGWSYVSTNALADSGTSSRYSAGVSMNP